MLENSDFRVVRDRILARVGAVGTEQISLEAGAGRVLAAPVIAAADVPSFDRSPYDGYAFQAQDTAGASEGQPVTLRVVDYIAAGDVPHVRIGRGEAAHLMTGAPVPEGADAVLPFESTVFTDETVTVSRSVSSGSNVIYAGEDVRKGTVLCEKGAVIDAGLAGTLAGQGIFRPTVYKRPVIAVISTGSELLSEQEAPAPGKIYNSNRYALQAACADAGCQSIYIGTAADDEEEICRMIRTALKTCDGVVLSGGVSVGDYDCTPAAMERAGVQVLARGLNLKPGMAGAYGLYPADADAGQGEEGSCGDIPVMALSGNPAACMTAFYAVVLPVLKKLGGRKQVLPQTLEVRLPGDYARKKQSTRLLRGKVDLAKVPQEVTISTRQGNQMLHSFSGADVLVEIPADASLHEGETAEAFLL